MPTRCTVIRILIAEDHAIVREGLKKIIALATDMQVVAEAATGIETLEKIRSVDFDLLLLDMFMPQLQGMDVLKRLQERGGAFHVLVLSMQDEAQFAARALKAGASGFLTKDSPPEVLLAAIRRVAAGGRYIDPCLVEDMVFQVSLAEGKPPHERLSDREDQVLRLIVAGRNLNAIADEMALSAKTVSSYKARVMRKLGVSSNAELIKYALENGIGTVGVDG